MERIPIYDAKARLSEFGRLAASGRRFVVTYRGTDLFEMGPLRGGESEESGHDVLDRLMELTRDLPEVEPGEIRAAIDDGRE